MVSFFKDSIEGAEAFEAGILAHFGDGSIGVLQKVAGIVQSCLIDILVKVPVKGAGKYSG